MQRTPARTLAPLALMLLALAAALIAPAAASAATSSEENIKYGHESLAEYEQQLESGQVTALVINKRIRRLHITLKNGQHMLATYPPKKEPEQVAKATAKHVPVSVLSPAAAKAEAAKAPVHHKLRYIAGGILIAVIVIVGAVLLIDRRRKAAVE